MASPTPPQPPSNPTGARASLNTTSNPTYPENGTPAWLHNFAIGATVLAPIGLLLPPRRMDLRAAIMTSGFYWGSSQLAHDYTGRSLHGRFIDRVAQLTNGDLPERAQETQRRIADERARRALAAGTATEEQKRRLEVLARAREEGVVAAQEEEKNRGLIKKVWMGDEGEDWREKRLEEERKALQEGKGYYGLIADQIAEVFGRKEKKKDEEGKKKDGKGDNEERKD